MVSGFGCGVHHWTKTGRGVKGSSKASASGLEESS